MTVAPPHIDQRIRAGMVLVHRGTGRRCVVIATGRGRIYYSIYVLYEGDYKPCIIHEMPFNHKMFLLHSDKRKNKEWAKQYRQTHMIPTLT
jgi:hypothetical protein